MNTRYVAIWIKKDHEPDTDEEYDPTRVELDEQGFPCTPEGLKDAIAAVNKNWHCVEWGQVWEQEEEIVDRYYRRWEDTENEPVYTI